MSKTSAPVCVVETTEGKMPVAIEFHDREGRIQGFHFGHLLNYLFDQNPKADGKPDVPPDRFSIWFSTHDVVVLGWRLSQLAPIVRHGRLEIVRAADAKFYALSGDKPFVCDVTVRRVE